MDWSALGLEPDDLRGETLKHTRACSVSLAKAASCVA